jgi:pimeloyl-ACP methyl ester carboxylesterase
MMSRRDFSLAVAASAAASLVSTRGIAATSPLVKARNVVLVHGLFADGSSWAEVIPDLQRAGLNVTSVQASSARAATFRRSKPSFYAVSTEDRTINPDLQRFMAKRMGARTIEVKASHVSLISQPRVIADLILEAAGQRT